MTLDVKSVLHIFVTATHFSEDVFLDSHGLNGGQSVEGIWVAFTYKHSVPCIQDTQTACEQSKNLYLSPTIGDSSPTMLDFNCVSEKPELTAHWIVKNT